jgi:hypothetical protein
MGVGSLCLTATAFAGTNATSVISPSERPTVMVVVGAAGEDEFGKEFVNWAAGWRRAIDRAGARPFIGGLDETNSATDLAKLKQAFADEARDTAAELWLVLIGHGTFDGKEAKFNLRGPDLSATELVDWLKPLRRPVIVINCASASGPFVNKLSAPGRVILSATRSGYEANYARFGKYLAEAIGDATADLDKDQQVSLLEAFIMASRRASEFYETDGRLVTEHALLDDNGDGLGTSADFFRGVRAVKKAAGSATVDGLRAHQIHLIRSEAEQKMPAELRAKRDDLELALARLRETKATLNAAEYYRRLENLMLELARVYSNVSTQLPPAR